MSVKKRIDPDELWPHTAMSHSEHYDFLEKHQYDDWDLPFALTKKEEESGDFLPKMNYIYPLPDFERRPGTGLESDGYSKELKKRLDAAGAVTVIRRIDDDKFYLALTGGGMNMSWDICAGYIALGYLPPLDFCEDLPRFAGANYKDIKHQNVLLACQRSATYVKKRGERAVKELHEKFIDAKLWRWDD